MKYFKLLASAIILNSLFLIGNAHAATSATQVLQCNLNGFVNITANDSASLTTNIIPETGLLEAPLTSKFDIQSNSDQTLYLRAKIKNNGNTDELAFFKKGADMYVLLGHSTNKPTPIAITDAKSPTAAADKNANVIAYKVTGVTLTGASASSTPVFKTESGQYEIEAKAGASQATTTISTAVDASTYSFADTSGTYLAEVTLTTSAT